MDPAERSGRIRTEGRRLLEVAGRDLDAAVPGCPGWNVRELVGHVATVWNAIEAMVTSASPEPRSWRELPQVPEADPERVGFADEALARLVASLAAADPAAPVWTWAPADQTMGFYLRRAHNETIVHRLDAELALGDRTPIDPRDAIDVVDELYSVVLAARQPDAPPAGSLHLHQTDGDGEFLLSVVDGGIVVAREHAKGDAALRATGDELAACVWRRRELDGLELFGDRAVADQWMTLAP